MASKESYDNSPFPWHLGIYDAHCHPTDTMSSIDDIPAMKATTLTVMATREQDQELVSQVASNKNAADKNDAENVSSRIIPCFGWHPWFSHQIFDDTKGSDDGDVATIDKVAHYKAVLSPPIEDETLIRELPAPRPLSSFILETRTRLEKHPNALVGEIGLDRSFRIPNAWLPGEDGDDRDPTRTPGTREYRTLSPHRVQMSHQRDIFRAQLELAGELQRPVSIHSVQAHGAIYDVLRELWTGYEREVISSRQRKRKGSVTGAHGDESADEIEGETRNKKAQTPSSSKPGAKQRMPFPPRICMHSYSGPVEPLNQFLHPSVPADIYFSFSDVINFSSGKADKVTDVIKSLPEDKILVESDLHRAGGEMDDMLEQVTRRICSIRGWELDDGVRKLGNNWKQFVSG